MKILRFALVILHSSIVFLLLGTLLNAYIPPKIFPWFNLLSLSFPLLLITHFILIIFWIICWRKRAFVFLFMTLFLINPIKRWVNFSSDVKETPNLKIVSLNTKGGKLGIPELKNYINSENADIYFLQENPTEDNFLEKEGLHFYRVSPIISMYSKYKVIDKKQLISSDLDLNSYADYFDMEIHGKVYRFINIYLQPFQFKKAMVKLDGNSEENEVKVKNVIKRLIPTFKEHENQVKMIRKGIDESPYPVFVMGDFNAVPNSYEYYYLQKGLKDAFVEVGKGSGTSFHDYKFPLRIDYVFTSKEIIPVTYTIDRNVHISDHFPIITEFKLEK